MAQTHSSGSLDKITEPLSLEEILVSFNNPINEEQAWAVCHQCAQYFVTKNSQCKFRELYVHGRRSVRVKKDGDIYIEYAEISRGSGKGPPIRRRNSVTGKDIKVVTETDAIQALGLIIYHALDYGLGEHEERHLSRDLERLLEVLINPDEEDEESQYAQDEGIEKDAKEGNTFQDVVTFCAQHLSNAEDAGHHYKAVCRALVAEAGELVTFLDKISNGQENLAKVALDDDGNLEDLRRSDWARLWVQIMRELRRGVRLKKVEDSCITRTEYELTPFEIILEDIRSRRYSLNKVMVNGDIPPNIKKDAHAVILDFIRSRPPLHPVKERILKSPPQRELEPREKLMVEIRSQPKLKPVQAGRRLVETSRTKLNNEDELESPQPAKKLIKPDFSLLLDSFDETDTDDCSSLTSSRRSSVASPSPERDRGTWRRAVVRDSVTTTTDRHGILTRRNTITVCESPNKKKWNHPIECLSLTLEEVTHIRMVLTKAELEQLISNQEVYNLVSKGKMCFTCKLVKFSMFGQWGTRCKICKRNVCNNCLRKMNIPTEHFQNIPVHTLSPIPLGQDALDILKVYESTGSVPHTPNSEKKDFIQTANLESKSTKNRSLQRSHTIGSGTPPPMLPNKNLLKGPLMNVCCDCKSMIMEIIRTSRTSIALINQRKEGGAPAQAPPTSPGKDRLSTSSLSLNIKSFFSK